VDQHIDPQGHRIAGGEQLALSAALASRLHRSSSCFRQTWPAGNRRRQVRPRRRAAPHEPARSSSCRRQPAPA